MSESGAASTGADEEEDLLLDEGVGSVPPRPADQPAWGLLVVDDDLDVHSATKFALAGLEVLGRPLRVLHAYSAAEARVVLEAEREIAAILLDVVMETQDAGLRLVSQIRDELGILDTRIILRTGQPGYAPEIEAIRSYDINDYKTKSELTQARLFATLTTAIRSYQQIRQIDASRRGLERIVGAATTILAARGASELAREILHQVRGLLESSAGGLVCSRTADGAFAVLASSGPSTPREGDVLAAGDGLHAALSGALAAGRPTGDGERLLVPFSSGDAHIVVLLDGAPALDPISRQLLDVFAGNVALGLKNTGLLSQLQAAAYVDPLCGIPNRAQFVVELDARLAKPARAGCTLGLVDLDLFADVNDALGHRFGDRLLRAVRDRLVDFGGQDAVVARVSGDVFGILGPAELVSAERLAALFERPFRLEEADTPLSMTLGMVRLDDVQGDGSDALKEASIALRRAKAQNRGGHAFFTRDMAADAADRVLLLHALRDAIEGRKLHLAYQPQLDLATGRVVGAEALVRWRHEGKMIPPDRFIPVAERSGLILPLGAFVLEEALLAHGRLRRAGFEGLRLSVNVSMCQVRLPSFVDDVAATLARTGAPAPEIELEITESVAMEDPALVGRKLAALKELGLTIAIDDFGTGYSSLSQLQRLPVDRLKIDRAFVSSLDDASRGVRIADTIVQLARTLDLSTIAEGIETTAQRGTLEDLGCAEGQGYLFARPLPEVELVDWLATRSSARAGAP